MPSENTMHSILCETSLHIFLFSGVSSTRMLTAQTRQHIAYLTKVALEIAALGPLNTLLKVTNAKWLCFPHNWSHY